MITKSNRYSPKVELTLAVAGHQLALSHVGPRDVIVREECEPIPPTAADLIITVDDESETYRIYLPNGIPSAPQKVAYN
jgi:hypothetical protein